MQQRKSTFRVKLRSLADGLCQTSDDLEVLTHIEDQVLYAQVMGELADAIASKLGLLPLEVADMMDQNRIRTKQRGDMVLVQVQ